MSLQWLIPREGTVRSRFVTENQADGRGDEGKLPMGRQEVCRTA